MLSIVIPAYNEAAAIQETLERVAGHMTGLDEPFEIIVVDDGSTDITADIVTRYSLLDHRIRLIRHGGNRGKGAAVRTGVAAARGTAVVFLDADLSAPPDAIGPLIAALSDHDLTIGSRYVEGAVISQAQPLARRLASRVFNLAVRSLFSLPFRDTQCGCKAFGPKALAVARVLETDGWAFDVELLARAQKNGLRIAEIGIPWNDRGRSRVRLSHAGRIFRELIRVKRRVTS